MSEYQFLHTGSYVKIILHDIPERPGVFAKMTTILANHGIDILTVRHSVHSKERGNIAFTVAKERGDEAIQLMKDNLNIIEARDVTVRRDLALVFIWGDVYKNLSKFAADILKAFSEYNIEFDMLSISPEGITCILPEQKFDSAMHAFNKMFIDEPVISPI